jgi:hypothetical protein
MKTVNFLEAVNSGKRFKVVNSLFYRADLWYEVDKSKHLIYSDSGEKLQSLASSVDFINSQFELEEKQITITESQMDDAIERVYSSDAHLSFISLKRELGF